MYINIASDIFSNFIPENIEVSKENYGDDTYELETNVGYIRYIKNIYEYEEITRRIKEECKEPIFSKNAYEINPFPEEMRFNILMLDSSLEIPEETNSYYGTITFRVSVDKDIIKGLKMRDITLLDLQCLGCILVQLCMLKRKQVEAAMGDKDTNFGPVHFITAVLESCMNHTKDKVLPFFNEDRQRFWSFRNDMIECITDLITKFSEENKQIIDNIITEFKKFIVENKVKIRENATLDDVNINDWILFQLYMMRREHCDCSCGCQHEKSEH